MIIANIELSKSEDHSIHAKKYGGGSVFAKYARVLKNNGENIFYDFAPKECFENIKEDEVPDKCVNLSDEQIIRLRNFEPIVNIIPEASNIDIFIFNNDDLVINTFGIKASQVLWHAFVNQSCHSRIPNLFIYSKDQNPYFNNQCTKVFKVKIGKPVAENFFKKNKEDFLFQCTRHDLAMDTIQTIKLCNKSGVKGYFAGPILDKYPLLDFIDNKNTFYIGLLSEEEKIDWSSRARLYGCIQNWDTIFSLSAIESLGQGTPLICRNRGCFKYIIEDNINGFYYNDNEKLFSEIWEKSKYINQIDCYNKALEFSEKEMVESFYRNFQFILKNS